MADTPGPRKLPTLFISRVRAGVGAYMVLLGILGDEHFRWYPRAAWALTLFATGYAVVVLLVLHRRGHRPLPGWVSWAMCVFDTTIIAVLAGLTGGGQSPFAPVLLLVVIALALRFNLRRGLAAVGWTAPLLAALILFVPEPDRPDPERAREALWWMGHLTAGAVLAGVLSDRLNLAHRRRAQAESEAEVERARGEMERVLRRRLEDLDGARREFLSALLSEFRPSVSSLSTLSRALRRDGEDLAGSERDGMLERMDGCAHHLDTVLREVAEVLISESIDAGQRVERVDVYLPQLVGRAATMAGLALDRLTVHCPPEVSLVRTDADKCLRVVVKLVEEAMRAAPPAGPVEVHLSRQGDVAEVRVRGGAGLPGPASGLGLWIASRLAEAMGGGLASDGPTVRAWFPVSGATVPVPAR
ncbi:MAG: sensor histidine kinase [Acidimicrobiia bacterium]